MKKKSQDTSWNAVADWYDSLVQGKGSFQQEVILPNIIRLAGSVTGKRVLDIASGQGFFSHEFAQAGAHVTGVELSPKLVELAREHAGKDEKFFVGSAEKLPEEIKADSYDVAFCILALQNIKKLDEAIRETSRVLKSGGQLLLVLNHPCFRIPKRSSWGFDETQKIQYRRVDGYLSESSEVIIMHPGKEESSETFSFHRSLQLYFKLFTKHKFVVERLEEWNSNKISGVGPRKAAEDRARKEFPLFLALGLRKLGA